MQDLRIIFAGTPSIAATQLQALIEKKFNIICALTKPDTKAKRGQKNQKSSVKLIAETAKIKILQPTSLKSEIVLKQIQQLQPDLIVVVAYGLIIPQAILDIPRLGCINMHVSLLPRWRGAAPIQRAIQAGDTTTGITIMQMDAGMDTGAILHTETIAIAANETSLTLFNKAETVGTKALLTTIKQMQDQTLTATPQINELATYAHKITKAEAKLDWHKSALTLTREIRAFNPWPISYLHYKNISIKVTQASIESNNQELTPGTIIGNKHQIKIATTKDILVIHKMQLPNKKEQTVQDIINGHQDWFQIEEILQ